MRTEPSGATAYDGVVEAGVQAATPSAVRVPSVLRCGLMLFAVKMALKICGFARTIDWIRRRVHAIPEASTADAETVRKSEYAVAVGGALYPGRALCLEQSLVLYYLLRRQGVAARYCQGVQPHPFQAHAWVEYRGRPLNDVAEHVKRFAQLPNQLP